jgi:hypothetical protein
MDPVTCGLHESLAILDSSARYSRPHARESHSSARRKSPGDEAERQPSHASSSEPTFLLKNGRNQLSVSSSASEFGMGPNFTPTARESDSLTPAAPLPPASLPFPFAISCQLCPIPSLSASSDQAYMCWPPKVACGAQSAPPDQL